jgi:hypothetical protein
LLRAALAAGGECSRRTSRGILLDSSRRDASFLSKEEMTAAVWPNTALEEGNLTLQISALRRILDRGRKRSVSSACR